MKNIKYLIIVLFLFSIIINAATCTREGDQFRITDPDIGLVDLDSGYYNYYCLGIDHCIAKDGKYYNINSELVTLEQYYTSCGCRKDGNTYYDNHGNETTEENYNRICLEVGKCSIKNGKYYDNEYKEVTQEVYNRVCGCRIEDNKYYDNQGNITNEETYNRVCLEIGKCSIKNGKYYDNEYKEVTEDEYNRVCGCRIEDNKYYDDKGKETTVENYNKVCLNVAPCSTKDGKYYDNEYKETTKENYEKICGCRVTNDKYYGKNGEQTTKENYEKQCVNPKTGVRNIILIALLALILFSTSLFILNRQRQIKEL